MNSDPLVETLRCKWANEGCHLEATWMIRVSREKPCGHPTKYSGVRQLCQVHFIRKMEDMMTTRGCSICRQNYYQLDTLISVERL